MQGCYRSVQLGPFGDFLLFKFSFFGSLSATLRLPLWNQSPERQILLQRYAVAGFAHEGAGGRKLGVVRMGMAQAILEERIYMHSAHPSLPQIRDSLIAQESNNIP
jgi:hypothetical protein